MSFTAIRHPVISGLEPVQIRIRVHFPKMQREARIPDTISLPKVNESGPESGDGWVCQTNTPMDELDRCFVRAGSPNVKRSFAANCGEIGKTIEESTGLTFAPTLLRVEFRTVRLYTVYLYFIHVGCYYENRRFCL